MVAVLNVSANRMELARMKKRLTVSLRGHKLMKDKRDDLMKRFLELAGKNLELRLELEKKLEGIYEDFIMAEAAMGKSELRQALMVSQRKLKPLVEVGNIMGIKIPVFRFDEENLSQSSGNTAGNLYPYGFVFTVPELDECVEAINEAIPLMLQLAQTEKTVRLMADEIEKTRRRVNALEHVQIPALKETIKRIAMQLEENRRGELARLMKVKDMMVAEYRGGRKQ